MMPTSDSISERSMFDGVTAGSCERMHPVCGVSPSQGQMSLITSQGAVA